MSLIQAPTEDFKTVNQVDEKPATPEARALRHLASDMVRQALARGVQKKDFDQVRGMEGVLNIAADMIDREAMASTLETLDVPMPEIPEDADKLTRVQALFEHALRLRKAAQLIEFTLNQEMSTD